MKYIAIYDYLAERIGRDLSAGDKIPSERELCERFSVSRMTVRQAVDALVNEGLLVRQQGKGTFVAHQKLDLQLRITSFAQEMRMRGMVPSTRVLMCEERQPPTMIASSLGLSESDTVYLIKRLRFADGIPMAVEEAWLPAGILPNFITPAPPDGIYAELQARGLTPTWGEDNIESVPLDRRLSQLLDVSVGTPSLLITRRTFADDVPVFFSVAHYRGDRYKLWVPISQPLAVVRPSRIRAESRKQD